MKKRTKRKKSSKNSLFNLKYIVYILLIIIFSLSAFIAGILVSQKGYEKELKKTQDSLKILQQKIKKIKQNNVVKKTKAEKTHTTIPSEILDLQKAQKTAKTSSQQQPKPVPKPSKKTSKTPKLVIIIDDVSFKGQVKKIKDIPYKVTPSFFPPTSRHPNTPVYAKEFSHYMIHLPMQAVHFSKPEPKTLNIDDSYSKILNRIKEVKADFPKAKFVNNHTGSTFTSNQKAMTLLFKALKSQHMGFVDSKTTPSSKAYLAEKKYKIPLYSRNIFLDNIEDPGYIKNQLKKAVKIAKKRGYAIAIGHPHTVTLMTLKNSKDILKDVKVVYIDEL